VARCVHCENDVVSLVCQVGVRGKGQLLGLNSPGFCSEHSIAIISS
jgi:hypothetical protein